ncbi:MAG: hypothetical protein R6V31_11135 [Halohasta sp.]
MPQEHTPVADGSDAEVMASIDGASGSPSYIIADISRDDAWLSVRQRDAPVLAEWC